MAAATAGIEHGEIFERRRPAIECPRRRRSIVTPTQVFHLDRGLPIGNTGSTGRSLDPVPCTPPGPDGVVQQELHHVRLGEKLRDGRERAAVDLFAALINLLLLLGLPELVDPAETVVSDECISG